MKKIILSVFMLLLCIFSFCSCFASCEHEWEDAICTKAKACKKCYQKEGEPLGHTTDAGRCERCGTMVGAWQIQEAVYIGTGRVMKRTFTYGEFGKYETYNKFARKWSTSYELNSEVWVEENDIIIKLWVDGDHRVTGLFSDNPYRISVSDESQKKYVFSGNMERNDNQIFITENRSQMIELLKKRQILSFCVENESFLNRRYSFEIDTTGFLECYTECYPFWLK